MVRPAAVLLALLLVLAAPSSLHAEEKAGRDQDDESRVAAEIGRGLLSPEKPVRRRAEARLLDRIRRGGDLEAFVRAMSNGVAAWANRHERLMEVWIHQAVHGDDEVRERAVRLLAALGAPAIRRLSIELRHRMQLGAAGEKARSARTSAAGSPPPEPPAFEAKEPESVATEAATPRLYDLTDLVAAGMDPLQLRSLLQKAADAQEVRRYGTSYVVTASKAGHKTLIARLHEMRSRPKGVPESGARPKEVEQAEAAKAVGKPSPPRRQEASADKTPGAVGDESAPPRPAPPAGPQAERRDEPGRAEDEEPAVAALWRVRPFYIVRLPATAHVHGLGGDAGGSAASLGRPRVRVGTTAELATWSRRVRRIPDAQPEEPVLDPKTVALGSPLHVFSGRELRYSKDVRRTKGGAWTLQTDTIRHGLAVDLKLTASSGGVRVTLAATHTEVGLPIPVVSFRPAPDAAPVELERPEWSTTRARVAFDVPREGGGAVVSLAGLGPPDGERILLVMTFQPALASPPAPKPLPKR